MNQDYKMKDKLKNYFDSLEIEREREGIRLNNIKTNT